MKIHNLFITPAQTAIMKKLVTEFLADERGATAIEYGLIAAGIGLAIMVALGNLGVALKTKFSTISSSLK